MPIAKMNSELQQILEQFAKDHGGTTSLIYQNILNAIQQTPTLMAQMNEAAEHKRLLAISNLTDPNAAGAYSGEDRNMHLPLSTFNQPLLEQKKLELITTLAHEIQHANYREASAQAFKDFRQEVEALSKSGKPQIDYTAPFLKIQANFAKDESQAEIMAWNAFASYEHTKHPHKHLKLSDIGKDYGKERTSTCANYDENTQKFTAMHQGYVTKADGLSLDLHNPKNLHQMQHDYYDGVKGRAGSHNLGTYGDSDYVNAYAPWMLEIINDAHLKNAPTAKLFLDSAKLKISQKLVDENCDHCDIKYYDVNSPNIKREFNSNDIKEDTKHSDHLIYKNKIADPYKPDFERRAKQNQTQAQNLHSQANKFCRAKIAELNLKWDAGMEKTVHAMTALAFKHDLKNIDSLSLSNDRKSIIFADNNSGQKLHLSSGIAAETSIEQSQNNIAKVSAERQNLSTNLAIPAKLRGLLADKNLSEQQLQNVAANVQAQTPNANYAAQDIAIKDGNLLVLYQNSKREEAAVGKEINLQQAIQTPAEQSLAQQNQQQQQTTQTPNHDGPTLKL